MGYGSLSSGTSCRSPEAFVSLEDGCALEGKSGSQLEGVKLVFPRGCRVVMREPTSVGRDSKVASEGWRVLERQSSVQGSINDGGSGVGDDRGFFIELSKLRSLHFLDISGERVSE
jgi:hypothetical protein